MINTESIHAVEQQRTGHRWVRPIYDGYGFAQIPQTVRSLLVSDMGQGVPFGPCEDLYDRYDAVILFFIDAFGWQFVERFSDHPFLGRFERHGLVNKLTSQFPSTTAAHVTTIHTGLPVGQSGIYEWFYYEPVLDTMISPLMYSFAGDHDRDTLKQTGIHPEVLFPTSTIYQDLANHGVHSFVIQDHRYTDSPYTKVVSNGATLVPYRTLPEALASLYELLQHQKERSYYFLYYDKIDSVSHQHGPSSLQAEAEIQSFLDTMENFFHGPMCNIRQKTLYLQTADHGQMAIDPATTFNLNLSLPELMPLIKRTRHGQLMYPAGSTRDVFLHIREGHLEEAIQLLQHRLGTIAQICRVTDLITHGYFGSTPPSAALLSRIGDLVILPYEHQSVWWYEKDRLEQKYYGQHGGLSPEEMETVLLVQRYGS